MRQPAADFPYIPTEGSHQRHADRPRKLDILDIFADDPTIGVVQALQPFPHWFAPRIGVIKPCWQPFETCVHQSVSILVRLVESAQGRKCFFQSILVVSLKGLSVRGKLGASEADVGRVCADTIPRCAVATEPFNKYNWTSPASKRVWDVRFEELGPPILVAVWRLWAVGFAQTARALTPPHPGFDQSLSAAG